MCVFVYIFPIHCVTLYIRPWAINNIPLGLMSHSLGVRRAALHVVYTPVPATPIMSTIKLSPFI